MCLCRLHYSHIAVTWHVLNIYTFIMYYFTNLTCKALLTDSRWLLSLSAPWRHWRPYCRFNVIYTKTHMPPFFYREWLESLQSRFTTSVSLLSKLTFRKTLGRSLGTLKASNRNLRVWWAGMSTARWAMWLKVALWQWSICSLKRKHHQQMTENLCGVTGLILRTLGLFSVFILCNGWICLHGVLD